MIRVLIVAAYASVRAGLQALLSDVSRIEIIAAISGSAEIEDYLRLSVPVVVVFDDDVTDRGEILDLSSQAQYAFVLLTDDRDAPRQLSYAKLPGWSCLLKESDADQIAAAVFSAASGLVTMDASLQPTLGFREQYVESNSFVELPDPMTAREIEVLQLVAQGLPNKVIATKLLISQHTVKFHIAGILSKLNASSRTEAVTKGARRGLVTI
jgi:NarL family two-component system response regulator YdfI